MAFLPLLPLLLFILGLVSLAFLGVGLFLIIGWFLGIVGTVPIVAGALLTAFSLLGRPIVLLLLRRPGQDEPNQNRDGAEVQRIKRPDGTELQVEMYGPRDGQPIILTHGWGINSTAWYYVKRRLSNRFRLIVWDLQGSGLSSRPQDNNWSLERLASHLEAVLAIFARDKHHVSKKTAKVSLGSLLFIRQPYSGPLTLGRCNATIVMYLRCIYGRNTWRSHHGPNYQEVGQ